MTDRKSRQRRSTKSLNQRHTAWYQLASAAGTLLDRFQGQVDETNLNDLRNLRDCVQRVMEVEGIDGSKSEE